jgi:hypothetical protein
MLLNYVRPLTQDDLKEKVYAHIFSLPLNVPFLEFNNTNIYLHAQGADKITPLFFVLRS